MLHSPKRNYRNYVVGAKVATVRKVRSKEFKHFSILMAAAGV